MDDAVADGVGEGGIREVVVPVVRRELARDDRRACSVAVLEKLEREVRGEISGLAKFESPKKFGWLEREFTIEGGELTPKLSVKRRVINEKYQGIIDALYADPTSGE